MILKSWIVGIVCSALLISLANTIMPNGMVKKVSKLLGGIVLLIAVVRPVLNIDMESLSEYTVKYNNAAGEYSTDLMEENERLMRIIIEEESAAYILDKAETCGANISAVVHARLGDGEYPYPYSVDITGEYSDTQKNELTEIIEADLAIPIERQYWEERDE